LWQLESVRSLGSLFSQGLWGPRLAARERAWWHSSEWGVVTRHWGGAFTNRPRRPALPRVHPEPLARELDRTMLPWGRVCSGWCSRCRPKRGTFFSVAKPRKATLSPASLGKRTSLPAVPQEVLSRAPAPCPAAPAMSLSVFCSGQGTRVRPRVTCRACAALGLLKRESDGPPDLQPLLPCGRGAHLSNPHTARWRAPAQRVDDWRTDARRCTQDNDDLVSAYDLLSALGLCPAQQREAAGDAAAQQDAAPAPSAVLLERSLVAAAMEVAEDLSATLASPHVSSRLKGIAALPARPSRAAHGGRVTRPPRPVQSWGLTTGGSGSRPCGRSVLECAPWPCRPRPTPAATRAALPRARPRGSRPARRRAPWRLPPPHPPPPPTPTPTPLASAARMPG
jgi:hypothetical protein